MLWKYWLKLECTEILSSPVVSQLSRKKKQQLHTIHASWEYKDRWHDSFPFSSPKAHRGINSGFIVIGASLWHEHGKRSSLPPKNRPLVERFTLTYVT